MSVFPPSLAVYTCVFNIHSQYKLTDIYSLTTIGQGGSFVYSSW